MVDAPLGVEVGDTDPHGGAEQETDQFTLEPFEVVALNGRVWPGAALLDVGVIVTITGVELPQPSSRIAKAPQNTI